MLNVAAPDAPARTPENEDAAALVKRMGNPCTEAERLEMYTKLASVYNTCFQAITGRVLLEELTPFWPGRTRGGATDGKESDTDGVTGDVQTPRPLHLFDVGCGTGKLMQHMVGEKGLSGMRAGLYVTGADYCDAMLGVAKQTGLYDRLINIDITKPFALPPRDSVDHGDSKPGVDIITVAGVFFDNHVEPPALRNVLDVLDVGGLAGVTVRAPTYEVRGEEFARIVEECGCVVLSANMREYIPKAKVKGIYLVLRKVRA